MDTARTHWGRWYGKWVWEVKIVWVLIGCGAWEAKSENSLGKIVH